MLFFITLALQGCIVHERPGDCKGFRKKTACSGEKHSQIRHTCGIEFPGAACYTNLHRFYIALDGAAHPSQEVSLLKTKKLLFILNPRAGRNKPHGPLFDALAILSGAGYLIRIHETSAPGDAADTAAREGAGYDLVVAAGGDGTLNEVISGLMRLDAPPPLGYLPQGTTNDFASSLQIPRTPASAAKNIVQNRMRELDIGRWNERSFIYVASFGAFTRSSYAASQAAKNALGHFAYILEGMKDLNTLRPYHIRLTADGEVLDGDYLFGAVCNSTSIGGLMKLDPERVVLDDGKFEMLLVPSPKTAADLQNLVLALLNQQYDSQGLVFRHVSSLRLETEEELPWSLDGEYAPSVPVVDIVNRQRALRMLL